MLRRGGVDVDGITLGDVSECSMTNARPCRSKEPALQQLGVEPVGFRRGYPHLSFSSSCRLVRHLSAIIEIAALAVLDPRQDLALAAA